MSFHRTIWVTPADVKPDSYSQTNVEVFQGLHRVDRRNPVEPLDCF